MSEATREQTIGLPYGRARSMGGGVFMVFSFHATLAECTEAIENRPEDSRKVENFPVYFPHLDDKEKSGS